MSIDWDFVARLVACLVLVNAAVGVWLIVHFRTEQRRVVRPGVREITPNPGGGA